MPMAGGGTSRDNNENYFIKIRWNKRQDVYLFLPMTSAISEPEILATVQTKDFNAGTELDQLCGCGAYQMAKMEC